MYVSHTTYSICVPVKKGTILHISFSSFAVWSLHKTKLCSPDEFWSSPFFHLLIFFHDWDANYFHLMNFLPGRVSRIIIKCKACVLFSRKLGQGTFTNWTMQPLKGMTKKKRKRNTLRSTNSPLWANYSLWSRCFSWHLQSSICINNEITIVHSLYAATAGKWNADCRKHWPVHVMQNK